MMEVNASAQSLLAQIRDYQSKIESTKGGATFVAPVISDNETVEQVKNADPFSTQLSKALSGAIDDVNALQTLSADSQKEFQMGGDIPLTEVVMNMQKASLAFEATVQVRNKVLTAYQEIINMPV